MTQWNEQNPETVHYWPTARNRRGKKSKHEINQEVNQYLPEIVDLSALTIPDMKKVQTVLKQGVTAEPKPCNSKKEYVAELSRYVPEAKSLSRLGQRELKVIMETLWTNNNM